MVETAHANSLDEFMKAAGGRQHVLFRGQSREYPAIIPSLFRLREPLDLAPLLKAADDLYLVAHKVVEEMIRIRELDEYYTRPLGRSRDDDIEKATGLFGRLRRWLGRKLFPSLYRRDDADDDDYDNDGYWMDLSKLPVGSGMGTTESYSKIFDYAWRRVPNDRRSMAMLQHYGAPSGTLDVSFERLVALWFACHVNVQTDGGAFYKRNEEPSVVYIMDVPADHLIDIRGGEKIEFDYRTATVPVAGLRGWRQHGGLVFGSTIDDPDLTKYVVKKITVAPDVFDQNDDRLKLLTQQRLFPSPEEDDYYSELLKAKEFTRSAYAPIGGVHSALRQRITGKSRPASPDRVLARRATYIKVRPARGACAASDGQAGCDDRRRHQRCFVPRWHRARSVRRLWFEF